MPATTAIVMVDMQLEFFSPEGVLPEPVAAAPLVERQRALVTAARAADHRVVWVTSTYPPRKTAPPPRRPPRPVGARFAGVPMNDDRLASGHAGKPCCAPGSPLRALHPGLTEQVRPGDLRVDKHRYSAFGDTDLAAQLAGTHAVVVCGVLTSTCVRATATDAFFLGFDVTVPTDAVAATSKRRHDLALEALAPVATLATTDRLVATWRAHAPVRRRGPADGGDR
jgi:nicotinamidase-related amidase